MTTPTNPVEIDRADQERHPRAVAEGRFTRDARSVARARELVARHLEDQGWSVEAVAAARLVTSELATNAVLHAETDFHVRCLANDDVRIEIADRQPEGEVGVSHGEATADGGRGLHIVAASSNRWGVERDVGGKTVWCELNEPTRLDD